jgi:nucleoside-diphosphate-sugar epimerase
MKVLMIGGTGIISTATTQLLSEQGHDLTLINRGENLHLLPNSVKSMVVDIDNEQQVESLIQNEHFDAIVDWIVGTPEQAERDIRLFSGKTNQYVFISSASAYRHTGNGYMITEETPLGNDYWEYSRNKILCEQRFRKEYQENGFPVTIVRPSLTFGETVVPYVLASWQHPWSIIDRIKSGKRVIVPGDGTSLWTITFNTDFAAGIVGLLGNRKAIGEAFHITSDETLTWNEVVDQMAQVIGVKPNIVHISSDFIEKFMPDQIGNLHGDKIYSTVFDNSKLKSFVPSFQAKSTFQRGFTKTYAYLLIHPELQTVDELFEEKIDRIIRAYDFGLSYQD